MLYDTRWNTATTELDRIISWLETQRARRRYQTTFTLTCLFGRYARTMGIGRHHWGLDRLRMIGRESNRLFLSKYHRIASPRPHTYGAALARARKLRGW